MCSQDVNITQDTQEEIFNTLKLIAMSEPEEEPQLSLSAKQRAMTQPSTLTAIKRSDVPEYLRKSQLYLSLSEEDDDDEISVPYNCMKRDLEFKGVCDFEHLLLTMRFWIKKYFPSEAIEFMLKSQSLRTNILLQRHKQEHPRVHCLLQNLRACKSTNGCAMSCEYGRLDFLNYFVKQGWPVTVDVLKEAAINGHLDCVKYVHKILEGKKANWRDVDIGGAARAGHLECLKYLVKAGLHVKLELCASATEKDQLPVLKYLFAQRRSTSTSHTLHYLWLSVVQGESVTCGAYLLETFPTLLPTANIVDAICRGNKTKLLTLLLDRGCVLLANVVTSAASMGSMVCLQYLHEEYNAECWVPSTMSAAAQTGEIELVLQLLQRGCPFTRDTMTAWFNTEVQTLPLPPHFPYSGQHVRHLARQKTLTDIRSYLL